MAWWIERGLAALAALLLAWSGPAQAQHAVFEAYQQSDGLTNMAVGCLTQAADGTLWLCTENGLFRFDGFRIHREPMAPGAQRSMVQAARADARGGLWVATDVGLFLRREKDGVAQWSAVTQPGGKPIGVEPGQRLDIDAHGTVLAIDRSSRIWSIDAPLPGAAPVARQLQLPAFPAPPGELDADSGPLRAGRGALWFGCGRGLCEWRDGTLRRWGEAEGLPARMWGNLVIGRDGSVWARSRDRLARLAPAQQRFSAVEAPLAQRLPATAALAEDPAGGILTATDVGIARWDGQRWREWTPAQGLPETLIRSLFFDAEGSFWLGTSGRGLHCWIGYLNVEHWTPALGLPAPATFTFARDGSGRLWAGTARGAAWLDESTARFRPLPAATGRPASAVSALAVDASGDLWWVETGRVMRLKAGTAHAAVIFDDPSLSVVMQGRQGGIYLTGRNGVDRVVASASGPRRQPVAGGLPDQDFVSEVAFPAEGVATSAVEWFISGHRAYRPVDGRWMPMRDAQGEPVEVYGRAAFVDATDFWAFDSHGLSVYAVDAAGTARFTRRFDLARFGNPTEYFLRTGSDGRVWFGTDRGVFVFDGSRWWHIDHSNGLLWDDIDDGAVLLEPDGTAWIGSSAGVTRIRAPAAEPAPPVLRLKAVAFGDQTAAVVPEQIDWNDRHLQFTLGTPNIGRSRMLHLEYRLHDNAPWQAIAGNVVTIESPEDGTQVLEVRAAYRLPLVEAGPPLQIPFTIAPPWWLSTPAKLATAAGLGLLWWLSNWATGRRQRAERRRLEHAVTERTAELEVSRQALRRLGEHNTRALEDERKRIARELHDEMGQQLAALRMEASVLRTRARGEQPPAQAQYQVLLDRIDNLAGGVRALVKQLRPPALDGGLAAALEWLAAEFTQATGLPCRLQVDADADRLAPDIATQVFRVAQESLTNVRRHAHAARVDLALQRNDGHWLLAIADDGAGFDPSHERSGHGLLGMEERARLLGGTLDIAGRPGSGTTVRLHFEDPAAVRI
jgi:signal transduction histidine kinase